MESNDKSKEIDIKNCAWQYFDEIIKVEDFNFGNILIDKKRFENILVYNISYRTLTDAKL